MPTFVRSVHHDLPPDRVLEVVRTTASRLGFAPEAGSELAYRRGTWGRPRPRTAEPAPPAASDGTVSTS